MQKIENQLSVARYAVVRSDEGTLAVWPNDRLLPVGWMRTDTTGSREECLAYIKLVGSEYALRRLPKKAA